MWREKQTSTLISVLFLLAGCRGFVTEPTPTATTTSFPSPSSTVVPTQMPTPTVTPLPFHYETEGPFIFPSWGHFGWDFWPPNRNDKLHPGIDIWTYVFEDTRAHDPTGRGNPVFVVYDGVLGRSLDTGYINVCHTIDDKNFPDLDLEYNVCTYYAHLVDLPPKFADLPWGCNNKELMIPVEQGELIGYMGYDIESGIHLHFSVKLWDIESRDCWNAEASAEDEELVNWPNMRDPLPYFGLESGSYSWMDSFAQNQCIEK